MSRSPRNLVLPLLAGAVLLLAACGSGAAAGNGAAKVDSVQSGGLPGEHVHGVARDPGDGTVYLANGVTLTGHLAVTTDAGATWTTGNGRVDSAQAISASRGDGGTLEVLLVTDSVVQRSVDSGASFSPLVTN